MCNCYALRTQYVAGNAIGGRIGVVGGEDVAAPLCTPESGNEYFPYCETADSPQAVQFYRENGLYPYRRRPVPRPCDKPKGCCCLALLLLLLL